MASKTKKVRNKWSVFHCRMIGCRSLEFDLAKLVHVAMMMQDDGGKNNPINKLLYRPYDLVFTRNSFRDVFGIVS